MKEFFNNLFFKTFCISILIGFFSFNLSAQAPQWIIYSPQIEFSVIHGIAFDSLNNKWIGTSTGLYKFNGVNWVKYDTTNSGLPENSINNLTFDKLNNLWICTYQRGVVKYNGDRWILYDTNNSGIKSNTVPEIAIDNQNIKWFAAYGKGLVKYNDTNWVIYNTSNSGIHNHSLFRLLIENNIKWIGTVNGLIKFNDTNWVRYYSGNSGLPDNWVGALFLDNQRNKWMGTRFGGASKFNTNNNIWTIYDTQFPGLPANEVFSILIEDSGMKWFGTNSGLAKYNDTVVTVYGPPITSNTAILVLKQDKYGNIWIGTDGGLYVHNPNGIVGISYSSGIIPENFKLFQNFPNPFNSQTKIKYSIKKNAYVSIKVFDCAGKMVNILENQTKKTGEYEIRYNISVNMSSGIYFYSIYIDGALISTRKMALIR